MSAIARTRPETRDPASVLASVPTPTPTSTPTASRAATLSRTHWETTLFTSSRADSTTVTDGEADPVADRPTRVALVSARAAYQAAIHGRGLLVDVRPAAQRTADGEIAADLRPLAIERDSLQWRLDPHHPARLPRVRGEMQVIIVCHDGGASAQAAESLAHNGVHHATAVIGGFLAWRRDGMPADQRP